MRTQSYLPTGKASQQTIQQPSVWLRISLVVAIALALATAIAAGSTDSPYEDRLVDLALRQSHGPRWSGVALNSSAVKAMLLDYDNELAFKAQLAIEKYGDDAQDVLLRFGDDPSFQEVVRLYGENTIPVISYFVKNDIASIRLFYLAQQKSDAAIAAAKGLWATFWHQEKEADSTADKAPEVYGPDVRGQQAIAMILRDGHQFLGQFLVDPHGQAAWVQTERTVDAVKSLFFSGAINLERKYKSGKPLEAVDVLNAGVDVFIFVGAFKALKFLRATQEVRAVGVMQRTQLLGAPLLRRSALGRYAMKYGVAAGVVTLMVWQPSLMNGVFVMLGKSLGVSPFLAKTIGWGLLLALLLLPLLSLLTLALSAAGTLLLVTGKGLRWTRTRLGWRTARTV